MAWVKHETTGDARRNRGFAVYTESSASSSNKVLDVSADLGPDYVIRPTLIEIHYTASSTVGLRRIKVTHTDGAVELHRMILDIDSSIEASETRTISMIPINMAYGLVGGTQNQETFPTYVHPMMPVVLQPGHLFTCEDIEDVDVSGDFMKLILHADLLSGLNTL